MNDARVNDGNGAKRKYKNAGREKNEEIMITSEE